MCLPQTHANLRVRCTCLVACNVMRCLPHSTINLCSGRESTRGHHLPPPQPTAERPVRAVSRHHQEALNVAQHRFWHWFSQSGLGEVARTMQSTTDLKHDAGPCIRCCRASWLFFRIHSHVYCTTYLYEPQPTKVILRSVRCGVPPCSRMLPSTPISSGYRPPSQDRMLGRIPFWGRPGLARLGSPPRGWPLSQAASARPSARRATANFPSPGIPVLPSLSTAGQVAGSLPWPAHESRLSYQRPKCDTTISGAQTLAIRISAMLDLLRPDGSFPKRRSLVLGAQWSRRPHKTSAEPSLHLTGDARGKTTFSSFLKRCLPRLCLILTEGSHGLHRDASKCSDT